MPFLVQDKIVSVKTCNLLQPCFKIYERERACISSHHQRHDKLAVLVQDKKTSKKHDKSFTLQVKIRHRFFFFLMRYTTSCFQQKKLEQNLSQKRGMKIVHPSRRKRQEGNMTYCVLENYVLFSSKTIELLKRLINS